MLKTLARNWWLLALRGGLAILFGVLALFFPGIALTTLVFLFGAYALVDGGVSLYAAVRSRSRNRRWWVLLLEGVAGIVAGILTFIWPGITALVLLYLIAFWAMVTGVLEIAAAFELRQEINNEWLLGLSGVLSILFGILLVIAPGSGALAVTWLIGIYAIMFGIVLISLSWRLRNYDDSQVYAG